VPSGLGTWQTGDAQADCEGRITPDLSMSERISSSVSRLARGGLRGCCLIGCAVPVSISCCKTEEKPKSVHDLAKVSA